MYGAAFGDVVGASTSFAKWRSSNTARAAAALPRFAARAFRPQWLRSSPPPPLPKMPPTSDAIATVSSGFHGVERHAGAPGTRPAASVRSDERLVDVLVHAVGVGLPVVGDRLPLRPRRLERGDLRRQVRLRVRRVAQLLAVQV